MWSAIGAIGEATQLKVTTAVTCPTVRIHPAVVAQATATSALTCRGGFRLGVGSGEALNEHITGARWPTADVRLSMLEEAVEVMRRLLGIVVTKPSAMRAATDTMPSGPDLDLHVERLSAYVEAGYDEVYVSQVGPFSQDFFDAYEKSVLPGLRTRAELTAG